MARVTRNMPPSRPTQMSQAEMEARVDPKNQMYGVDPSVAAELARYRERGGVQIAPLASLPTASSRGEFAQTGAYVEGLAVFNDLTGNVVSRSKYNQLNAQDFGYDNTAGTYYEGMDAAGPRWNNLAANYGAIAKDRWMDPAPISVIPTSTSNLKRPRTVAAGYRRADGSTPEGQGTLTVVFRDGTYYNYYDVTPQEWQRFKIAGSKGPLLNPRPVPGFLMSKNRGEAALGFMSEKAQELEYRVAATSQQVYQVSDKKVRINGRQRNRQDFARPVQGANLAKRAAKVYGTNRPTANKPRKP